MAEMLRFACTSLFYANRRGALTAETRARLLGRRLRRMGGSIRLREQFAPL